MQNYIFICPKRGQFRFVSSGSSTNIATAFPAIVHWPNKHCIHVHTFIMVEYIENPKGVPFALTDYSNEMGIAEYIVCIWLYPFNKDMLRYSTTFTALYISTSKFLKSSGHLRRSGNFEFTYSPTCS